MEYGRPKDIFALDYFGHRHGMIPTGVMKKSHKAARREFQENFPGSYVVMGPPPSVNLTNSTILNRCHIKAYAVGNKVLSLGGVNCVPASYGFIDVMLDFESDIFVRRLHEIAEKGVHIRKVGAGERFSLDPLNEILIDYGRRNNCLGLGNKSIIMDSLLDDLRRSIKTATLSSTSVPSGRLDSMLAKHMKKGADITFYANHPSKFRLPLSSVYERWLAQAHALKAKTAWIDKRPDKFNHLKTAVITYKSGQKVAYVGSHNFHDLHVWAGNAEVCLRTTDLRVIGQLEGFIAKNLSGV